MWINEFIVIYCEKKSTNIYNCFRTEFKVSAGPIYFENDHTELIKLYKSSNKKFLVFLIILLLNINLVLKLLLLLNYY